MAKATKVKPKKADKKYEEKLTVNGSFLDLVKVTLKSADKKKKG